MKYKFLMVLPAFALMAACASDDTKPDSDEAAMNSPSPTNAPAPSHSAKSTDSAQKAAPPTSSAQEKASSALQDAVKSQSDENIYRAATQVLSQSPQDLRALNALGLYHYKRGKLLAAQYFFSKALAANPSMSEAHSNMGLVHLGLKEPREAIKSFRKALEGDPNNAAAASNLGAIYVENKDYNKALIAMEIAMKRGGKDYKTLVNYGVALAGTGHAPEAKGQYEQAIKINSTGKEAMYNLASLQIEQLKQYQEGLDLLNKLKFIGVPDLARMRINVLENKAKAGLK